MSFARRKRNGCGAPMMAWSLNRLNRNGRTASGASGPPRLNRMMATRRDVITRRPGLRPLQGRALLRAEQRSCRRLSPLASAGDIFRRRVRRDAVAKIEDVRRALKAISTSRAARSSASPPTTSDCGSRLPCSGMPSGVASIAKCRRAFEYRRRALSHLFHSRTLDLRAGAARKADDRHGHAKLAQPAHQLARRFDDHALKAAPARAPQTSSRKSAAIRAGFHLRRKMLRAHLNQQFRATHPRRRVAHRSRGARASFSPPWPCSMYVATVHGPPQKPISAMSFGIAALIRSTAS